MSETKNYKFNYSIILSCQYEILQFKIMAKCIFGLKVTVKFENLFYHVIFDVNLL